MATREDESILGYSDDNDDEGITLMMEAVQTSELLVYCNETTPRYIPEGSNLHTRHRENLKPHKTTKFCLFFEHLQSYILRVFGNNVCV
jgi:hypothetical protein